MFFSISKILGVLASPLNLCVVLLLGGLFVRIVLWRRGGHILMGAGILWLVLFGVLPVGHNIMVQLEGRFARPRDMPATVDGIIVLGGSLNVEVTEIRRTASLNNSAERILAGVELSRRYPDAALVFSGGDGRLMGEGDYAEQTYIEEVLHQVGFDTAPVLFETDSRTTYENLRNSLRQFEPEADGTWVLVTSAWHMPRAAAVMRSMDWPGTVIYWPVDYRTDGETKYLPSSFDTVSNMDKSSIALHEVLGWLTYRLTGRINAKGEKQQ